MLVSLEASTTDYVLFVSNLGRVYAVRANKLPETSGRGESLRRVLSLAPEERSWAPSLPTASMSDRYLVQFTRLGKAKKSALREYRSADTSGLADMNLQQGDGVQVAFCAEGGGHYLVVTSDAKALRFDDSNLRASGRVGQGVQAISLSGDATVMAAFEVSAADSRYLVTLSTGGMARRRRSPSTRSRAGRLVASRRRVWRQRIPLPESLSPRRAINCWSGRRVSPASACPRSSFPLADATAKEAACRDCRERKRPLGWRRSRSSLRLAR